MSNKKSKLSPLVAAALVSATHGVAGAQCHQDFVPLENLSPSERLELAPRLQQLEKIARIDWNSIVAGVDANGELVLLDRDSAELQPVAEPSCWVQE